MADTPADTLPENHAGTDPDTPPEHRDDDARSDIEQAVASRSDAVERGEGGPEPERLTGTGDYDGHAGTGSEVKNQDLDAQ